MLSQNIAYPIGEIYKDIRELLSCLEDAEVQGDIPELSTEWWNEIGKIYPEFRKEVEKETDDIGPTLQ